MRSFLFVVFGTFALAGAASAQAPAAAQTKGYVEGVAQSAFGNVTSQSYGGEIGVNIKPNLQVFVEAGRVGNAAPSTLGASAQLIAGYLGTGFTVTAKEPITFGVGGVRYLIPSSSKLQPYVMVGGGAASVKKNVVFSNGGTDVTGTLSQYGVVLGSDLSGSETKGMLSLGAGATWPVGQMFVVDFQYRFGRVFASDGGINVNRVGIGIGIRF
jgi:opacity protein-like surface antigen